nr:MAG TPA: hypothetical protein [Bacteriophage sp.]
MTVNQFHLIKLKIKWLISLRILQMLNTYGLTELHLVPEYHVKMFSHL